MSKRIAMKLLPENSELYAQVLGIQVNRAREILGPDSSGVLSSLEGAVRARHWRRVLEITESLEVQQYSSILDQYVKTQLVALVKKYPFTATELPGFDPEKAAWKKFQTAEHRCRRINQRSNLLRHGVGFPHGHILCIMRGYIKRVLGEIPAYQEIYELCDWGPGANVGVTGDRTNLARKLLARPWTVTPLALSYCTQALWSNDQLKLLLLPEEGGLVCYDREKFSAVVGAQVRLVTFNNISFVPKTFKTHRSIASEPLLNGFLQKGIDQYMRLRLKHAGIDLTDQTTNQLMARQGSQGGFNPYVTLDLSSASDSIATGIVKTLLPSEWYEFLNSVRSHQYNYRGSVRTYEKFVSMGNGFCFPLQTLLFAALAYAVCVDLNAPVDFRVYGDDIIVRQSEALKVVEVLHYLGFRTNPDKTHIVGPFRESCGADWYCGQDVRPVYMDYRLNTNVDLYKIHNSSLRSDLTYGFFEPMRAIVRRACPEELRFLRPFHGNPDAAFTVAKDQAMSCEFVTWNRNTWAWRWLEVKTSAVRDALRGYDPSVCNKLEYLAVLRSTGGDEDVKLRRPTWNNFPEAPTAERQHCYHTPRTLLAVRRKSRASVRQVSYWGPPGHEAWVGAAPGRDESPR